MASQSEWRAGNESFYNVYKSWQRAVICLSASASQSQDDDDDDDDAACELAFH